MPSLRDDDNHSCSLVRRSAAAKRGPRGFSGANGVNNEKSGRSFAAKAPPLRRRSTIDVPPTRYTPHKSNRDKSSIDQCNRDKCNGFFLDWSSARTTSDSGVGASMKKRFESKRRPPSPGLLKRTKKAALSLQSTTRYWNSNSWRKESFLSSSSSSTTSSPVPKVRDRRCASEQGPCRNRLAQQSTNRTGSLSSTPIASDPEIRSAPNASCERNMEEELHTKNTTDIIDLEIIKKLEEPIKEECKVEQTEELSNNQPNALENNNQNDDEVNTANEENRRHSEGITEAPRPCCVPSGIEPSRLRLDAFDWDTDSATNISSSSSDDESCSSPDGSSSSSSPALRHRVNRKANGSSFSTRNNAAGANREEQGASCSSAVVLLESRRKRNRGLSERPGGAVSIKRRRPLDGCDRGQTEHSTPRRQRCRRISLLIDVVQLLLEELRNAPCDCCCTNNGQHDVGSQTNDHRAPHLDLVRARDRLLRSEQDR